ncbi:MAG: 4Fe-4S dicluster domain-containing protein [Anaerolineae bacterium]|jgi:formate dehydrogenase iron-sulfur subunit
MSLDRRQFIKLAGLGLGGVFLSPTDVEAAEGLSTENKLAILYDTSKCIGCRACQNACREWNETTPEKDPAGLYDTPSELSADTWTLIKLAKPEAEWPFVNYQCMHCTEAACVNVCPTGAVFHDERGFVSIDQDICNGCGYCTQFCPYGVPHLGGVNLVTGEATAAKCTFCQDRIREGIGGPFCAERCPTQALVWGNREELLDQARARVDDLKGQGFDGARLYGENEAGGLHRLSILLDDPSVYDLPADPRAPIAFSDVWQRVIQPLGGIAVGATGLGLVINWLVARTQIKVEEV